jgi:hypothetical protein
MKIHRGLFYSEIEFKEFEIQFDIIQSNSVMGPLEVLQVKLNKETMEDEFITLSDFEIFNSLNDLQEIVEFYEAVLDEIKKHL